MAYGIGGADPFAEPMALAMGYGILFAAPITRILLPCSIMIQAAMVALGQAETGQLRR